MRREWLREDLFPSSCVCWTRVALDSGRGWICRSEAKRKIAKGRHMKRSHSRSKGGSEQCTLDQRVRSNSVMRHSTRQLHSVRLLQQRSAPSSPIDSKLLRSSSNHRTRSSAAQRRRCAAQEGAQSGATLAHGHSSSSKRADLECARLSAHLSRDFEEICHIRAAHPLIYSKKTHGVFLHSATSAESDANGQHPFEAVDSRHQHQSEQANLKIKY